MRSIVILSLFFCVACSKAELPVPVPKITAEEAVARANADLRRVNLPTDLKRSGDDLKKIAAVYNAAVELGDENMQRRADERLSAVALPIATETIYLRRVIKLQNVVPKISRTWQKLEERRQYMEQTD